VWQDGPVMAAGWSNRYHFFADGTYIYVTSQMDCGETRERQRSGTWELDENSLFLTEQKVATWVGGTYRPATASCGTKELVGYKVETTSVNRRIQYEFTVKGEENFKLKVNFAGNDWWQFTTDPAQDADLLEL
jgi:hypothetical protein